MRHLPKRPDLSTTSHAAASMASYEGTMNHAILDLNPVLFGLDPVQS